METVKSELEQLFEQSVEASKQEQKQIQENFNATQEYDSWQIEMMHWGVHY